MGLEAAIIINPCGGCWLGGSRDNEARFMFRFLMVSFHQKDDKQRRSLGIFNYIFFPLVDVSFNIAK